MTAAQNLSPNQQIYADLMEEAKIRIHAVRDALLAKDTRAPRLLQEFVCLQYRMLCEIIAVGCLIAHDDIRDKSVLGTWKIPDIIERLERLNPDFYPRPVRISFAATGMRVEKYDVPHLAKAELLEFWRKSGNILHRGSAKSVFAGHGFPQVVDPTKLTGQGQKILNLIDQHVISSANKKTHLIVTLSHLESGGRSAIWVGASP
jgi:hypothetical protein